jgi:hypothetical protein
MVTHPLSLRYLFAVFVVVLGVGLPAWQPETALAADDQRDPLILSYAAKFVCQEALQPGQYWYGPAAPIVQQKTDVLIHNPNAFPVTLYKKAVAAPLEEFKPNTQNPPEVVPQGEAPGKWYGVGLRPDYAFRIDCDDIAKLLTGDPAATFASAFGLGVVVEGFVVIGIGPQPTPTPGGATTIRFPQLDVTAEYARSSEVMKKDIHYQPWWWWWWWALPWRLGYPYERIVQIDPARNIDCRSLLYDALARDAAEIGEPSQLQHTLAALEAGRAYDPVNATALANDAAPALVAIIGRCDKLDQATAHIDYALLSNKGPTDPDPRSGTAAHASQVRYPWIAGRWYDLPVVMPQNISTDIDDYFRRWHGQRWIDAGETAGNVRNAMVYWFPYWCGWGYGWWWWHNQDCVDIGVGEGESLDVEQITPVRVFYPVWPPVNQ